MERNLSDIWFRADRDGKWQNMCFEELTEQEQDSYLAEMSQEKLRSFVKAFASVIKKIGDECDILTETAP